MYANYTKLHVLAFGFAFGILGAFSTFIMGLFAMRGYGVAYVAMVSSLYIGFAPTFLGSVLGAIWGFFDLFVFGILLAALYNCFSCKGMCRKCGHIEQKTQVDEPPINQIR